jgi:eukaryotic-like serine/threonine-protein kinase
VSVAGNALFITREDENLQGLVGVSIPSEVSHGVSFRPGHLLGKGGGAVAFFAHRVGPEGESPVVIKILRPAFVRKLGPTAHLLIRKEAVALGRLNERVPPTPFVIRLIDTGTLRVNHGGIPMELPWVAVEYVHGGALGTTLAQRVRRAMRDTGYGFDAARAAGAIDAVGSGLAAVHEVGVFHRDLTPSNVLCSGRGGDEIFKIADFGVARPVGITGTLSGALLGTPGYAAPELAGGVDAKIGPFTDVFSFASIIFFVLTGEPLFTSASDMMRALDANRRRGLLDMPGLHPELREREAACRSIDLVLAWATAAKPEARLSESLAVSSMVLPHLAAVSRRPRMNSYTPMTSDSTLAEPRAWTWTMPYQTGSNVVIRSVAWDGHGRAIAATAEGLSFWNGTTWRFATTDGLRTAGGVRFVQRVGAGRWILGGDDSSIAIYKTGGAVEMVDGPRDTAQVQAFAGDLEDISVLAVTSREGVPCLCTYASKRWLKPLRLDGVASISAIARFDDARWLAVGRREQGGAFAALYSALDWELEGVPIHAECRSLLSAVARPRKAIGFAAGTQGVVLTRDGDTNTTEVVPGEPFLSAVSFDPFGRPWAASAGRIFMRDDNTGWTVVWENDEVAVPVVAMFLDVGLCIAMTADGGVIEGRAQRSRASDLPPKPAA